MHVKVTDADVFQMISEVDEDNSGAIGEHTFVLFSDLEFLRYGRGEYLVPFCLWFHTRTK